VCDVVISPVVLDAPTAVSIQDTAYDVLILRHLHTHVLCQN